MSSRQDLDALFQQLFRLILSEQSLVFNQVSSYEDFVESGLKNIVEKMFRISTPVNVEATELVVGGKKMTVRSFYAEMTFQNANVINPMPSDEAFRALATKGRVQTDAEGDIDDRIQCDSQET